jgi:hypothetical protein
MALKSKIFYVLTLLAIASHAKGRTPAASTNTPPGQVKQMERKAEHLANKIIIKSRDKGSKKESDWKTSKEFPLMFGNNRLGRKPKDNKK